MIKMMSSYGRGQGGEDQYLHMQVEVAGDARLGKGTV